MNGKSLFLAAAALLAAGPALAAQKTRAWRDGKLIAVQPPATQAEGDRSPVYGTDFTSGWTNPAVRPPVPMYSFKRTDLWLYAIESWDGLQYAAADSPGRKSALRSLKRGDQVRYAVAGRSLYLLDPAGKEHKLMRFESANTPRPSR